MLCYVVCCAAWLCHVLRLGLAALITSCVCLDEQENLDIGFTRKLLSGLAMCGAWACLDEFNRIGADVLSVVAQQVLAASHRLRPPAPAAPVLALHTSPLSSLSSPWLPLPSSPCSPCLPLPSSPCSPCLPTCVTTSSLSLLGQQVLAFPLQPLAATRSSTCSPRLPTCVISSSQHGGTRAVTPTWRSRPLRRRPARPAEYTHTHTHTHVIDALNTCIYGCRRS